MPVSSLKVKRITKVKLECLISPEGRARSHVIAYPVMSYNTVKPVGENQRFFSLYLPNNAYGADRKVFV